MASVTMESITQLPIDKAVKTLGYMTCPTGSNKVAIQHMQQQGQEWTDKVKSGHLSRRDMWFMVDHQLWPRMGVGCMDADREVRERGSQVKNLNFREQGEMRFGTSFPPRFLIRSGSINLIPAID
jgi:hypothetical protein